MIITLETFPIVIISTFLIFYLIKKENLSKKDIYELSKNFLLAILLVIFIFPSSILKFTYVKIYAMYFYRIFKKNNEEYDKLNYFENWKNIFSDNMLFFSIISFIIIILIFNRNKLKEIYIYLFYSITYSVIITPFILSSTYIFPSLFLMISMTLLFLNKINLKFTNSSYLLLFIIFGIIGNFYFNSVTYYKNNFKNYNEKIDYLISNHLNNFKDENIIIDGAHIINYYSLNSSYQNLNIFSIKNPDFYIRKDYQNIIITDKIKNKEFNKIIFQSNRNFQLDKINFLTINNYKLIDDKNGYKVYKLFNE